MGAKHLPATIKQAQHLRGNLTNAEQLLWRHLRMRQMSGCKFRRQRPIGSYIVDFVCLERRIIIELDGGQHAEQTHYDQKRDSWLESQGYNVMRFWDHDVLTKVESVKESIFAALNGPPP